MAGVADLWGITPEERAKHDQQFMSLKPVGGMVTGEQARNFFLLSGLPPPVLGHIWGLADMNADGKMDKKEFSIAVYLIQKKLKGIELPKVLPPSLKEDPVAGGMGALGGLAGLNMGAPAPSPVMMGGSATLPPGARTGIGLAGPGVSATLPRGIGMANGTQPVMGFASAGAPLGGPVSSAPQPRMPVASGEWAVPQSSKLKYTQMFNMQDRMKRGFLGGMEARAILTQSHLTHPVLAQIWSLADIDNDGKLTCDEFVLAMHLVDMAKGGQGPPAKLPPDLVPPSYRRIRSGSVPTGGVVSPPSQSAQVPVAAVPAAAGLGMAAPENDTFGDLLGGLGMAPTPSTAHGAANGVAANPDDAPSILSQPVTFEDKRKENFDKGAAELEKRRQALKEMQEKEEAERLAHEKAEQEKREKQRLEQERKKQAEMERLLEKQRQIEQQKEEERRKALEQREAARRELERQRQLEWERQRKEQLMAEKHREQMYVDGIRTEVSRLTNELDQQENKKAELKRRIETSKDSVQDFTSSIDGMRVSRDMKNSDIERFQNEVQELNQRFQIMQAENLQLEGQVAIQNNTMGDSYKTVLNTYNHKKQNIQRLKTQLEMIEKETQAQMQEIENTNAQLNELNNKLSETQAENQRLRNQFRVKQQEWNEFKRKRDGLTNGDIGKDSTASPSTVESSSSMSTSTQEKPRNSWALDSMLQSSFFSGISTGSASASPNLFANFPDNKSKTPGTFSGAQTSQNSGWGDSFSSKPQGSLVGFKKYKAMYQFDARNADELSLKVGDIIHVKPDQTGVEPGWMCGSMDGAEGIFPEAYVEFQEEITAGSPEGQNVTSPVNETAPSVDDSQALGSMLTTSVDSSFTAVAGTGPSPTPGQNAPAGLKAQALYPWRAKKDNHLTFDKGDIILVKEQQDMWWSGELNGSIGWFPKSYVKLLGDTAASPPQSPAAVQQAEASVTSSALPVDVPEGAEVHVALYSYSSSEQGDLSFNQGEYITIIKKDGDWWTGTIGDRTGIFPANYVKKVDTPQQPAQKAASKKPEIASVIAPYQATGPEQLSLSPGQLISVRKKSPSGWWEGELQARGQKRRIGWFPANYVKLLGTSRTSTPLGTDAKRNSLSASPNKSGSPNPDGSRTETPVPSYPQPSTAPALEQVVAMYTYSPQNDDELQFHKGSVINVVNKDDPDWWRGELNGTVGMFPSNYVSPLAEAMAQGEAQSYYSNSDLNAGTPVDKKRQNYIEELIDTEEVYMADMSIVIEAFHDPIKSENALTEEENESVFVNWNELTMCNMKLLKALRVRKKMTAPGDDIAIIGDILCENLPHMAVYIRFCSCQLNAAALIQRKTENDGHFRDVMKKCQQNPKTKGMPLSSFLLKPMQRITRYPLMIEKILSYTPADHPDHQNLVDALNKANETCSQVNEGVREKENSDKLEWLQTHIQCDGLPEKLTFNSITNCLGPRKFLHSGGLTKTKSGKELYAFLFNDFLLLTQPSRAISDKSVVFNSDSKSNVKFKMYRNPIFLNEVAVKKSTEESESCLFHISHIDKIYSLKTEKASERELWVKKLEESSRHYMETEKKKRERAHSLRKTVAIGRVLVVIMEGVNLSRGSDGKSDPYCEVSMGVQEHRTRVINNTLNPRWNASMQFTIKDPQQDVLCITVYDRDLFTPNDFLGRTEVRIKDILKETHQTRGPIIKRLLLHEVETGEVIVKLDLQLYERDT